MSDKKKNKKSKLVGAPKGRAKRRRPQVRKAYICECRVCGNGLVRFWNFRGEVVGLCDECELVWGAVAALSKKPTTKADGSFPGGIDRNGKDGDWKRATRRDVEMAGLDGLIEGYSD
ncbi:MAG: hypothetical protein ACI8XO_000940 [Verrucomicrobiales bacterium]|jgi:hypothetical protein